MPEFFITEDFSNIETLFIDIEAYFRHEISFPLVLFKEQRANAISE